MAERPRGAHNMAGELRTVASQGFWLGGVAPQDKPFVPQLHVAYCVGNSRHGASLWVVVSSGFRGMSFKPYFQKRKICRSDGAGFTRRLPNPRWVVRNIRRRCSRLPVRCGFGFRKRRGLGIALATETKGVRCEFAKMKAKKASSSTVSSKRDVGGRREENRGRGEGAHFFWIWMGSG